MCTPSKPKGPRITPVARKFSDMGMQQQAQDIAEPPPPPPPPQPVAENLEAGVADKDTDKRRSRRRTQRRGTSPLRIDLNIPTAGGSGGGALGIPRS